MKERLQSIQVLRAVAVIPVVMYHFAGLTHGRAGVDLFFVISGFVMAGLMDQPPIKFARDRFIRIYPPFLAALLLALVLVPRTFEPVKLAKSLLLWPFWHEIYLYPAWSLSYEALFYAACVASMFVKGRYVIAAYAALFLLGVRFFGDQLVLEFLAGFALARKQWWALPILLVAAAWGGARSLLYGPFAVLLLWLCVSKEHWFKHRLWAPIAMIGDASYAIYLTHASVGTVLTSQLPDFVVIWGCMVAGIGFHFIVEKPLLRYIRQPAHFQLRPA